MIVSKYAEYVCQVSMPRTKLLTRATLLAKLEKEKYSKQWSKKEKTEKKDKQRKKDKVLKLVFSSSPPRRPPVSPPHPISYEELSSDEEMLPDAWQELS